MLDHNPLAKCTRGERYEAEVPDTLDLADRMGLAINALTNVWYPEERFALGFDVDFSHKPAVLFPGHMTDAYLNIPAKFIEALVVCRLASGSGDSIGVDRDVLEAQLGFLGDDGLTYCPTDTLEQFTEERPFAEVWGEGRLLLALSMLAQVDDDPRWVEIGKRKIDRLLALTRQKDGFRFLWKGRFRPGDNPPTDADEPSKPVDGGSLADYDAVFSVMYSVGALGHGAGLFYRVTGYEPALELSGGLAGWALARVFNNDDGRWDFYHFHHSTYALIAICEYAFATNDREMLGRVDACYRWSRAMGDSTIGYYPEIMPGSAAPAPSSPLADEHGRHIWQLNGGNIVEICEVADMVVLALYLTRARFADYWDDVDRWVRNVYTGGQMLDDRFLEKIPTSYFTPGWNLRPYGDSRDVPRRSVGSFWGFMSANDALPLIQTEKGPKLHAPSSIRHCCTGNGSRTLYYVWDSIVRREGDEVTVELLLNRASQWLDVNSYLPVEGKVVLKIKDAPVVAVRMPEWSDPQGVEINVGGRRLSPIVEERYVRVQGLSPGDEGTLTFAVPERVEHRVIGGSPYKLTLRGSNVVSIDPKGTNYPLYENQPVGRDVRRERFVPEIGQIIW